MQSVFDLLGAGLAVYVAYAIATGSVYAKQRAWGRAVTRQEESGYFWTIIVIYALLAAALIGYF